MYAAYETARCAALSRSEALTYEPTASPETYDSHLLSTGLSDLRVPIYVLPSDPNVGYLCINGADFCRYGRHLLDVDGQNLSAILPDMADGMDLDVNEDDGRYELLVWGARWTGKPHTL